jgi:hypothetical protein
VTLAHQETTRQWWSGRDAYNVFVSDAVLAEAQRGDREAAQRRLALLDGIKVLAAPAGLAEMSRKIESALAIPQKSSVDAIHLAFAVLYRLDCLLTWNCAHLANAGALRRLHEFAEREQLWFPIICTPDEMLPTVEGETREA